MESKPGSSFFNKVCCNPFGKTHHSPSSSDLRPVQPWMIRKIPQLRLNSKICSGCRKRLRELPGSSREDVDDVSHQQGFGDTETNTYEDAVEVLASEDQQVRQQPMDKELSEGQILGEKFVDKMAALQSLNDCLRYLGEEPFDRRRLSRENYIRKKLVETKKIISEKIFGLKDEIDQQHSEDQTLIRKLKEKYNQTNDKHMRSFILTLIPEEWSTKRILEEFPSTSTWQIKKAAKLLEKDEVTHPTQRLNRSIGADVIEAVEEFYCKDDISRIMPGKKDFVSVKIEGKKEHVQKRLILGNLKEIYYHFKETYQEIKIGFSKFASLRPKYCVLAGSSGTHAVCVCIIHQNFKLMLEGCGIKYLTMNEDIHIENFWSCLALGICNPANIPCFFNSCVNCPGYAKLREFLEEVFENNRIESVTYSQWTSTNRSKLEIRVEPTDEFLDNFVERLPSLLQHTFITDQQNKYFQDIKKKIQVNEVVVVLDFSENYSFVLQDEIQSFHWSKHQATIHPFGIYFRTSDQSNVQNTNLVIISDCEQHNTIAVHLFQRYLIRYLTERFPAVKKIYYFSDGSAAQYKNRKNFFNLSKHEEEFQIKAEWNFFATAHGKSICDGLGGTLKRLAARASLQRPYNDQITTPLQLYKWAKENISHMNFKFVSSEEYKKEEEMLNDIYATIQAIPQTQKVHCVIPISKGYIKVKHFSLSSGEFSYSLYIYS